MRSVRIFVAVVALAAGLLGSGVVEVATATPSAAACVTPQSGMYVGSFEGANGASTAFGSATYDITFTGSAFNAVVTYVEGRTVVVPGSTGSGTFDCNTFAGSGNLGGDAVNFSGSVQADGTWSGPWSDSFGYAGSFAVGPASATVSSPSATALTTGSTVSPTVPLQASVQSPTPGPLSLSTALVSGGVSPGFALLGVAVDISAPRADDTDPLTLTMTLDPSVLNGDDPSTVQVFENGAPAVQWCGPSAPPIDPSTDPCEVDPPTVDPSTGAVTFTVLSSQASVWTFGVRSGLAITTSSLPDATPGAAYGPVALQQAGAGTSASPYTTTFKWEKVTLPKGLKLSKAGVLSGKPGKLVAAGRTLVTVQVTEKVTTLNGKMKVKTTTTAQATIALTIS
jgi:hypothetical protein